MQKIVSGTKTIYFRSAAEGNVRKEFVDSGAGYAVDRVYAYLNGSHLASYSPPLGGGWKYTFRDHLGTLRVRTRSWGAIVSRHDFYPFGGEHTIPSSDEDHLFTDQERDAETGLDYFIARHYGSNIGRFLQPDEPFADQAPNVPASWNLYSYVRNNPVLYQDDTGRDIRLAEGLSKKQKTALTSAVNEVFRKESGKALVEKLDANDFDIVLTAGDLGQTSDGADRFGETRMKLDVSSGEVNPNNSTITITIDVNKIESKSILHGMGVPVNEPPSTETTVEEELLHANEIVDKGAKVERDPQKAHKAIRPAQNTLQREKKGKPNKKRVKKILKKKEEQD